MTGESREMTLDEWVDRLPPHHGARRERDRLREVATEIADLRERLDAEASHRLSLCADNERFVAENAELRKARERAKPKIEKAVELIQRWCCECEPQIGFTCGPCRVVEIIDAAMGGEAQTHD